MADESGESHLPSEPGSLKVGTSASPACPGTQHSRLLSRLRHLGPLKIALASFVLLLVFASAWAGYRAYVVRDAYHQALEEVEALEAYSGRDLSTLERSDMQTIQERIEHLNRQITRVDEATALPFGSGIVERLYWVGPRYEAGRGLIRTARLLTHAGVTATSVGMETFDAFEATGANAATAPPGPTWLDVVLAREVDVRELLGEVAQAKETRAVIDERYLPEGARNRMDRLDRALDRYDYADLADQYIPLARATLGGDAPVRYLVLFQNPAELRPSGGFPGTMGIVEFERGQLTAYEIFDAHFLSDTYIGQNHPPRPQPWAIQEYFPSASLVLHDATWWADFPRSGRTILEMYQATGWPPIDGVVAVQPSVIGSFVRIAGNVTITVDGEERVITSENVYDEIERLRVLHREGVGPDGRHKEVLELIGVELIERFQAADRSMLVQAARELRGAADIRDVQLYMDDISVQNWLDERHWSGKVAIDESQPTLVIALANVVTNKASMRLVPNVQITLGDASNGSRDVSLEMWLANTGTIEEDPFYAGFSRWWVEIWLPANSVRGNTHPAPMPDPESPDGGSYLLATFPQETGYLSVTFTMPETDVLLLRRQPGVVPLTYAFVEPACGAGNEFVLHADTVVDIGGLCP